MKKKLLVLTLLFLCTLIGVYAPDKSEPSKKKLSLKDSIGHIEGYTLRRHIELSDNAVKILDLDDYFYADFAGKDGPVNLYTGYYHSAGKAYAAHSPTVCYPSQGWKIENAPAAKTISIGSHKVEYSEITTSLGPQKELALYWYQARLRTSTQVYRNKIHIGYNKLTHNDEHHGFVRVSVPYTAASDEAVKK